MNEYERMKAAGIVSEKNAALTDAFYEAADAVIENSLEYIQDVVKDEVLKLRRKTMDAYDYRQEKEAADRKRSMTHDLLILRIDALNRMCDKLGVERVYQGSEDRTEYGDFAISLVEQVFGGRVR